MRSIQRWILHRARSRHTCFHAWILCICSSRIGKGKSFVLRLRIQFMSKCPGSYFRVMVLLPLGGSGINYRRACGEHFPIIKWFYSVSLQAKSWRGVHKASEVGLTELCNPAPFPATKHHTHSRQVWPLTNSFGCNDHHYRSTVKSQYEESLWDQRNVSYNARLVITKGIFLHKL